MTMEEFAITTYSGVAYDLPRYGFGHFAAATDYIADQLFDAYHKSNPDADFRAIAKKVLADHVYDDSKEARLNEAKQRRREAAASRPPKAPKVKTRSPYGPNGITRGYRKGLGSH